MRFTEGLFYAGLPAELLMAECEDHDRRGAERRIRAAHFPEKSLRDFDYGANLNVDPAVIHNLATCDWIAEGYPLCLIGDSGTGRSDLLIALGIAAAVACYRVRHTTAAHSREQPRIREREPPTDPTQQPLGDQAFPELTSTRCRFPPTQSAP